MRKLRKGTGIQNVRYVGKRMKNYSMYGNAARLRYI